MAHLRPITAAKAQCSTCDLSGDELTGILDRVFTFVLELVNVKDKSESED